jgi:hypothetical protein
MPYADALVRIVYVIWPRPDFVQLAPVIAELWDGHAAGRRGDVVVEAPAQQ